MSHLRPTPSRKKQELEEKKYQEEQYATKKEKEKIDDVAERNEEELHALLRVEEVYAALQSAIEREQDIKDYDHRLKKSEEEARELATSKQTDESASTKLVIGDIQHGEKHANDSAFLFMAATANQIKLIKQIFDIYAAAHPGEREDFKAAVTPGGAGMELRFGEPTNNANLKQKQHEHVANFAALLHRIENNLFHLIPQSYDHSRLANYRGMSLTAQNTMNDRSNYRTPTPWDGIIYGPARTKR